jgi:ABC-type Fe3+-hydroxamate transport system substrate-binding protein
MKARFAFASIPAAAVLACGAGHPRELPDERLVVFGPSLVSIMDAGGMSCLIVGADRYSLESMPGLEASDVGGYLDPSFETVASLRPTSIHSAGRNRQLSELAAALGVPYYAYSFDRLTDVLTAMDSLEARYGFTLGSVRAGLEATLDSLRSSMPQGISISIVVFTEPGSDNLTLAGRETFLGDLVVSSGMQLAAPDAGTYPSVSVEGMLQLSPDLIFFAYPGRGDDSVSITRAERRFWAAMGFDSLGIDCGFGEDLLIPGAGLASTARRIASCAR